MTRHLLARFSLVLVLGLLGEAGPLGPPGAKASIVYTIVDNPAVQNGYTLSGTITTDGHIGAIVAQNILGWNWKVTNGVNTYWADSTQPGSHIGMDTLIATSDYIELPAMPVSSPVTLNLFGPSSHVQWSGSTLQDYAFTSAFQYNGSWPWWHDHITTTPHDVPGGWAIAHNGISSVPEPASLMMIGLSAAAIAGRHAWRRRQRAS